MTSSRPSVIEKPAQRDSADVKSAEPAPDPGFDLLESKLRPPRSPAGNVSRAALLELLARSRSRPLVLVSATAGYGKTTLLAQWAARSRRPFAWVSLDRRDNDPIVLLTYVATALDRLSPLDPGVFEALASPEASIEGKVVPRLISAMEGIETGFVLVLDDVHLLTDRQCIDAVDTLVAHIPSGSQVVLSGRTRPSARSASMRTRGLVLEIGPDELRMDQHDATELLGAAEVKLAEPRVAGLLDRTEGWPAGLYLAALSVRSGGAVAVDGKAFRGENRFVEDYLQSELLANLPSDVRRFLTRTAVLERFCAPLCDRVLDSKGSAPILGSLEQSNMFVVPLDQNREWFRYHHLFRELLLAELKRAEPDLVPTLLTRASDWSDEHGAPDDAVAYAQEAGDAGRVARLVITRGQLEYRRGRAATVEGWLNWLERNGALETDPAVTVLGAWFSVIRGDSDRAERWTDIASRAHQSAGPSENHDSIEAWLALLRAVRGHGDLPTMLADADFAVTTFERAGPFWSTAALVLGMIRALAGDEVGAGEIFDKVAQSTRATGAWNGASLALAERATLAIEREDWTAAEGFAVQAESIMRRSGMEDYPPNSIVYAVSARVAAHRGDHARATKLLAQAQLLRPKLTYGLAILSIQVRLELAHAYAALAEPAGARTMLIEADGMLGGGRGFGELARRADDVRSKLDAVRTRAPDASTLTTAELRLLPLLPSQLSFPEIGERLYLSRHTVKSHAMSIYRKLDVTSRTEAVERARGLGLL